MITQSGCNIRMKIQTNQMKSKTLNGKFVLDDYNDYVLYYHYCTDSRGSADKRYPTQYEACCAEPDMFLGHWAGSYFTDQLTRGRIHFCSLDELRKKLIQTDPYMNIFLRKAQKHSRVSFPHFDLHFPLCIFQSLKALIKVREARVHVFRFPSKYSQDTCQASSRSGIRT